MTIGIVAAAGSDEAGRLGQLLDPARVVRFDLALGADQRVVLDEAGVGWNGVRLETLDALLVHGFRYEDPVLPPADPDVDWGFWQIGPVIRQQSWSFLYSLLSHLERIGGPRLYNPLSTELAAFDRLGQLDRLARAGLRVPPLLCSNDDSDDGAVTAFERLHGGIVWRPVTGRALWQSFRAKQRRHLLGVERPPVLLAAIEPGPLLRAWVVDGRVVLVLAFDPPRRSGLEQLEGAWQPPALAPDRQEALTRAAVTLGLRWAAVQFVDGADGPVIYDIDPDPLVTELPAPFRDHLLACLAAALAGAPAPALPPPGPAWRPALLLRRMLGIQFDMEQSKTAE